MVENQSINNALTRVLGISLRACTPVGAYRNRHFHGKTAQGTQVFIKLLDDVDYWQRSVAAAPIAEMLDARTPRLLESGGLGNGHWWLMYEWRELAEFRPTIANIERAGVLLGRLHALTSGCMENWNLEVIDFDQEIKQRAIILSPLDGSASQRIQKLQQQWGSISFDSKECVIHGDIHWRNFGIDSAGEVVLFDWESAKRGHPIIDFGKGVDTVLKSARNRDAFLQGYHRHAGQIFPWPHALRSVRLWCAAGVLTYALSQNLSELVQHGYDVLADLEREFDG